MESNSGVPFHRLNSWTGSHILHCEWLAGLWILRGYIPFQVSRLPSEPLYSFCPCAVKFYCKGKTLCVLPSAIDFIPKKSNGSPSPCPSSSWISSLSFTCSRLAQWETFHVSDSKVYKEHEKKSIVAYPLSWHRLMPISCNCTILVHVQNKKWYKREALPPPVPPSCSYCFQLSWPWALWAGRVPGLSHHTLSGSQ